MLQTQKQIQSKAPKRPYLNFTDFCNHKTQAKSKLKPGVLFYPCLICGGRGWEYIGEPDPIEGNKLRDTTRCKDCKGSGVGSRKDCFLRYQEIMSRWQVQVVVFKSKVKHRRSALKKLTEAEITALKELGI